MNIPPGVTPSHLAHTPGALKRLQDVSLCSTNLWSLPTLAIAKTTCPRSLPCSAPSTRPQSLSQETVDLASSSINMPDHHAIFEVPVTRDVLEEPIAAIGVAFSVLLLKMLIKLGVQNLFRTRLLQIVQKTVANTSFASRAARQSR